MPHTNKEVTKLVDSVTVLKSEVRNLKNRINTLVDELHITKNDLNMFMEFLKEQHSRLEASENNQHQYPLFKEGFEMPTAKDENDG